MAKYQCYSCDWIYDEKTGDPENGIEPGTLWKDVPHDYYCPQCNALRDNFEEMPET